MSEQVAETWQDWARRHYTEVGRADGEKIGELWGLRKALRALLERRFGALPPAVITRLNEATDVVRLQAAILKANEVAAPDELEL